MTKQERIEALENACRSLLHLLDTAEGYICTDQPEFWTGEEIQIDGTTHHATTGITLRANEGTYFRQTFRDTEAVKRARGLIEKTG